jgi:hypothetical protein
MKEWSRKPTNLLTTSSSPVKTVSSSPAIQTSSSQLTLTGGGSSTYASTSSGAATAGSGIRAKAVMAGVLVNPIAAGVAAGAIGAATYGTSNIVKYSKKQKSGKQAAKDTLVNSAGVGVSVGLGIAAVNVVSGTVLALGSTLIVPVAAGTGVAYASLKLWNKLLKQKKDKKTK